MPPTPSAQPRPRRQIESSWHRRIWAGCREILVVVNPRDEKSCRHLFDDGRHWGLSIRYTVQAQPGGIAEVFLIGRDFIGRDRVGLILGDNLFYGDSLPARTERGARGSGAVIYAYWCPTRRPMAWSSSMPAIGRSISSRSPSSHGRTGW